MVSVRSTFFSIALASALVVSSNAFADNDGYGSGRKDEGRGFHHSTSWRHSNWAWERDVMTVSLVASDTLGRVPSVSDVSEGLGLGGSASSGSGANAGGGQGRGGAAPAPLLGLTLLGQFGLGAGLIAAIRRRRNKDGAAVSA